MYREVFGAEWFDRTRGQRLNGQDTAVRIQRFAISLIFTFFMFANDHAVAQIECSSLLECNDELLLAEKKLLNYVDDLKSQLSALEVELENRFDLIERRSAENTSAINNLLRQLDSVESSHVVLRENIDRLNGDLEIFINQSNVRLDFLHNSLVELDRNALTRLGQRECRVVDGGVVGGEFKCPVGFFAAGAKNYHKNNYTVDKLVCCKP